MIHFLSRRQFFGMVAAAYLAPKLPVPVIQQRLPFSMRFIQSYRVVPDEVVRFDVYYGYGVMRPEYVVRILDADHG